ncbi:MULTISPECIES: formimidoylglutamate deiminase [Marinomonas]|uniref:Formimidoylglutamate deiminase n=1 Tax=Marinomonas arctica TaxID=383750 RepID=A0A7H1J846_9GAMM|nr:MULTISPECIES: formimidoylglutamate deiminase [Marinomonas]QNT06662.1 formimidoylglutamate deiminase [Marinomonas arctica]GGN22573.1 formimidoylglutamate deiminase [Marinomonas arctica]
MTSQYSTHCDSTQYYFAQRALLSSGWAKGVLFSVKNGQFHSFEADSSPTTDCHVLSGPVLPTLANVHSHAFQRVMAGAAEVSLNPNDSFWSWRDLMYKIVQKLTPDDAHIIAKQLYIDMLKAGYTQVGEFHYLHHDVGGKHYNQLGEMSNQIIAAADESGMGLTLLPVLYSHSGFGGQAPSAGQARFINSTDSYLALHQACDKALANHARHKLGICFHSLRAVTKPQIETVLSALKQEVPIHIHIAEQQKEVQDSLAFSGQRPVEWLHNEIGLNERWCLVHATHLTDAERQAIATSQAIAGLCPTTEANLGDGIFPGVAFEQDNGRWGIGSDSHVSLSIVEELRTYEYGQRLRDQQRNRLYRADQTSVGDNLYQQALLGGNQACGVSLGLSQGNRADFMVLDESHPFIAASEAKDLLNRWLFATNENLVKDVFVAGKHIIKDFHHQQEESSRLAFTQVIKKAMYHA